MTAPSSPYLFANEAAQYLRYPTTAAFRLAVRRLGIPKIKRGSRLLFKQAELDRFMAVCHDVPRSRRTVTV